MNYVIFFVEQIHMGDRVASYVESKTGYNWKWISM